MLSVKQGRIKYHFLSLWYDSTCDWTPIYRVIGEHSNHYANVRYLVPMSDSITTINSWSQCLGQARKNILYDYLFGDKTIQNCLKIYATDYYDNDLLLRQETQKVYMS